MAILGFSGIGQALWTLLALAVWVAFWFVAPLIAFLGFAMSGGGGKLAAQGRVMYTGVFLGLAAAAVVGLWLLTRGDWLVRGLFVVSPLGVLVLILWRSSKADAAKDAKAEAIYAAAKAEPANASPAPTSALTPEGQPTHLLLDPTKDP